MVWFWIVTKTVIAFNILLLFLQIQIGRHIVDDRREDCQHAADVGLAHATEQWAEIALSPNSPPPTFQEYMGSHSISLPTSLEPQHILRQDKHSLHPRREKQQNCLVLAFLSSHCLGTEYSFMASGYPAAACSLSRFAQYYNMCIHSTLVIHTVE